MALRLRVLLGAAVLVGTIWLNGCGGHYKCGVTFGNSNCSSSGSGIGSGGGSGSGATISAANSSVLTYFLSGTSLEGAGFGGSTFANLAGFTAPTLPPGFADNMTIVNKQFVYVPMGDTTIQGFTISRSTGALTPIPGSPFQTSGGGTTDGAWSDPQGRFLFVGSEASAFIWVFQIDSTTGALTETAGSPYTTGFVAADIMTVDASGKFLYVGQLSPFSGVAGFAINQTNGALTPLSGSPFSLSIAQVRATPTGEFLLGVQEIQDQGGSATDNHVYVYSINPSTGIPTPVAGSPFVTAAAPYDVTISPNGKFVYLPEIAGSTLAPLEGFQMDTTTGSLTSLSGSPFSSLPVPTMCQFDQAGLAMICATSGAQMTALVANPTNGSLSHGADFTASPFAYAVTN